MAVPTLNAIPNRTLAPTRGVSGSGCVLVGHRSSADPSPCYSKRNTGRFSDSPVISAIIQSFRDTPNQAVQLLARLRGMPFEHEIIVNDDTHGKQSFWLPLLINMNEFYMASPNLHEVRAYNRLAQYAKGEFLMFVQGDTCLPQHPAWVEDAIDLFRALPLMAMLSGRAGFDAVLNWQMEKAHRDVRTWGSAPYKPLDYLVRRPTNSSSRTKGGIPFRFVPGVDNGPLFYRRAALLSIGGFDESYSCAPGHLSGHYDFEVSLRFWIKGWQVGVFYGGAANGIGGRKTARNKVAKEERHSNEIWNGRRVERLWAANNASISARIVASTLSLAFHLATAERREVARHECEARIGALAKGKGKRCQLSITESSVLARHTRSGRPSGVSQ